MNQSKVSPKALVKDQPLKGGQQYAANMKGGVLLVAGQEIYQNLFALSINSPEPFAKVLTNLDNPGKMNDSEAFTAYQYGVRLVKLTDGAATTDEVDAAIKLLSASRLQLFIGPNSQRVLDVELIHYMNSLNFIAETQGAADIGVAQTAAVPLNTTAWLSLPGDLIQDFKENMNFKASLQVELPTGTPAALGYAGSPTPAPTWAFIFVMAGRRIVVG